MEVCAWVKHGQGKDKLPVIKQSQGRTAQHREIVNNIAITTRGVRWLLHLWGDQFLSYTNV